MSPLLNGYIQTADIAHYYTHFCLLNIVVVYRFNRPNIESSVSFCNHFLMFLICQVQHCFIDTKVKNGLCLHLQGSQMNVLTAQHGKKIHFHSQQVILLSRTQKLNGL